jgi:colanic acid biosynthesis protein WcaH
MNMTLLNIPGWITDEEYNSIFSRVPRICVDLVIVTNEGFLLGMRTIPPDPNTWHLIGGRVRMEETVSHAIRRIAKDEVRIEVSGKKLLGYMEFFKEKGFIHSISMVFLVNAVTSTFTSSEQSSEIKAFTEIPDNTSCTHRDFLQKHLSIIQSGVTE